MESLSARITGVKTSYPTDRKAAQKGAVEFG